MLQKKRTTCEAASNIVHSWELSICWLILTSIRMKICSDSSLVIGIIFVVVVIVIVDVVSFPDKKKWERTPQSNQIYLRNFGSHTKSTTYTQIEAREKKIITITVRTKNDNIQNETTNKIGEMAESRSIEWEMQRSGVNKREWKRRRKKRSNFINTYTHIHMYSYMSVYTRSLVFSYIKLCVRLWK